MSNKHSHLWSFDSYSLDPAARILSRDNVPIPLEPKEFDLLTYMLKNANRLLTKRELMDNVWGDAPVVEARIPNVVHSIRKKVFSDVDKEYIATVWNEGYRFDADVQKPHVPDEACPWVGLRAFDEAHARYFYGRDDEVGVVVERLKREKIIAIVGSSGRGKSSLAHAGIVPALRHDVRDGAEWRVTFIRHLANSPLSQLSTGLLEITQRRPSKHEADTLAKRLATNASSILSHLLDSGVGLPSRVLLVLDQFEDVFSPRVKPSERETFITNIVAGVQSSELDLYVLLTVRTDFLQKIEDYPVLWNLVSDHQRGVRPFSREDRKLVIERPAEEVGLELEEGLADEILDDLGEAPGALPLLSHTMSELFKQRDGVRLTFRSYRAIGKVRGAIEQHADLVFDSLTDAEKEIARNVLIRLTDVGLKPGSDAGLRLTLDELIADPQRAGEVRQVIQKLSNERLLTTDSEFERSGSDTQEERVWVEVSHIALIQHWPLLARWLNEKRDALRIFLSVDVDAKRWDEGGKTSEFLYQDHRLTQALEARPGYDEFMEDMHREFLQASQSLTAQRHQEEQRRLRRRSQVRWLQVSLVLATLVITGIYWTLHLTKKERDLADSLRRAADSVSQQSFDPELSLLLAIESGELALTKQTESSLRQALTASRLRTRYVGHQKQIISVSLSPNTKFLLTGAYDKEARIWDVETGRVVRTIGPLTDKINWAAYSPDGSKVVTAGRDGITRVWDAGTAGLLKELRIQSDFEKKSVNHSIFSPDGQLILTGGADGIPRIWDLQSGAVVRKFEGLETYINTVAYSPDGKLIGAASGDGTGRVWDAHTRAQLGPLSGHQGSVLYISFSADSSKILTTGMDGTARVWDAGTRKELLKISGHSLQVNSAEFSPDGKLILTSGLDGTARIWDSKTGGEVLQLLGHETAVNSAIFSADGRLVFTASGDHTARSWSLDVPQTITALHGHVGVVYNSAFSPDGQRIATAGEDKTVRVWDSHTGQQLREIDHAGKVFCAVYSPDGRFIATAGDEGIGRVWDVVSGALVRELPKQDTALHSISVSGDGKMVVTAVANGKVQIWEVRTGNLIGEFAAGNGDVNDVQFSPDSRFIATAGKDNRVRVWNVISRENTFDWNVETGEIRSVAFSPDGQSLLAACADGTARVWDLRDKKAVAVLRGHYHQVNSAVFNRDGALILTAGIDQTVRLWEVGVRRTLLQFRGNDSPIMHASFSPDGRFIAVAEEQGNVRVIACEICGTNGDELVNLAKSRKTRGLTPGERERFLRLSR